MKKILLALLVTILFMGNQHLVAQESVKEANEHAQKLLKKVKGSRFKKFETSYEQALKDIAKIETNVAETEFGYDAVADNIDSWIALNNTLKKFGKDELVYKDEKVSFQIKDYTSLKTEVKTKASEAHYNAALNVFKETSDYAKRTEAFSHLDDAMKYNYDLKAKIVEQKTIIHYEEGLRIYNEGPDFTSKLKAEAVFKKALSLTKDYKDIDNLMAELYYNEAIRLSNSDKLEDIKNAQTYLYNAGRYVENYKDYETQMQKIREKGASIVYKTAVETEKEQSFEAQLKASKLYEDADKWQKGYKDALAKAKAAKNRASVDVYIVERDGSLVPPQSFSYELQNKTKSYISTPDAGKTLENISLADPASYEKAAELLGNGFVLIQINSEAIAFNYSNPEPATNNEKVSTYYKVSKDETTNEVEEEKISESDYKASKKILELSQKDIGVKLYEYSGTLVKTTYSSTLSVEVPIEIIDLRDPSKPVLLKTITKTYKYSDTKVHTSYSGDSKAKPSSLRNDEGAVATEEELRKKAGVISIKPIVKSQIEGLSKTLDELIKYRVID